MRFATLATALLAWLFAGHRLDAADAITERLHYTVEWRLIHAGNAVLEFGPSSAVVRLESVGMVSTLYKIQDTYREQFDSMFCSNSSLMESKEGFRHRETTVNIDRTRNRASLIEKDVDKNTVVSKTEVQVPGCVHDVTAGLLSLRRTRVEIGQSVQLPTTDGRKYAAVRIEAQEREQIKTPAGTFNTVRYEVNLLNGVVYTRKGRVLIWLTDDERRLPVQFVFRMNFPLGTVTLELEKDEHP